MTTTAEYRSRIEACQWPELEDLWGQIVAGNTPGWDAGKALEFLVLRAFQLDGGDVVWPYSVTLGDLFYDDSKEVVEQIDGFVTVGGISCMIECKDYGRDVNVEPIAKLRNQIARRSNQVIGLLFSRKGFTDSALILARFLSPQVILLWSGEELDYSIKKKSIADQLRLKLKVFLTKGKPDYNIGEPL